MVVVGSKDGPVQSIAPQDSGNLSVVTADVNSVRATVAEEADSDPAIREACEALITTERLSQQAARAIASSNTEPGEDFADLINT
jgi:hypothetical protein